MHKCIFCGRMDTCNRNDCAFNIHTCHECLKKFYQSPSETKRLMDTDY